MTDNIPLKYGVNLNEMEIKNVPLSNPTANEEVINNDTITQATKDALDNLKLQHPNDNLDEAAKQTVIVTESKDEFKTLNKYFQ